MTLAPFHFANWNAKCPTPPAAPLISTVTLASSGTGRWFRGVTTLMALHGSCVTMRAAGARLLIRGQDAGMARSDLDGTDLFALVAALAWLGDQASLAPRADRLFDVVSSAILVNAGS